MTTTPANCQACGRCGTDRNPLVKADGFWVHRSHTTDPGSGFYRTTGEE